MNVKVRDLKPGMNNVNIVVRVLSVSDQKEVKTRSGIRTISEAIVGDETGRVKLTLWGRASGKVKEGDVVMLRGAWTTSFKGYVQLNVGGVKSISRLSNDKIVEESEIPNITPKAGRSVPKRYRRGKFGK